MLVLPKISFPITKYHGLVTVAILQQHVFGTLYGRVQQGPQDLEDELGSLLLLVPVTGKM